MEITIKMRKEIIGKGESVITADAGIVSIVVV